MTEPVSPIRRERTTPSGKTPPQNLEMEQSTLGAILLDTEAFPKVLEVFTESDVFYHPAHRRIFGSMIDLYEKGEPIDLMTVSENLKKQGSFDTIGYEYLADLIDSTPTAANVKAHAKIVFEKALLRKLITVAGEVVTLAYEGGEDVETLIDQVEKMIFNVSHDRIGKSLEQIKKILKVSVKTIEKQFENKQLVTGAATGFKDLDGKTAGLHPSDLIIIAGRPSMGKTAFAMNIAQNLTIDNDENVVAIFSLEMSAEQLVLRMLCSEARVSGHKIRTGYLSHSDWPKLTTAAGRLHNCKMYIDDSPRRKRARYSGKGSQITGGKRKARPCYHRLSSTDEHKGQGGVSCAGGFGNYTLIKTASKRAFRSGYRHLTAFPKGGGQAG